MMEIYPTPNVHNNGYNYAKFLLEDANDKLDSNQNMQLPCGNSTPNLNIRFRYILDGNGDPSLPDDNGIYFHRDDE